MHKCNNVCTQPGHIFILRIRPKHRDTRKISPWVQQPQRAFQGWKYRVFPSTSSGTTSRGHRWSALFILHIGNIIIQSRIPHFVFVAPFSEELLRPCVKNLCMFPWNILILYALDLRNVFWIHTKVYIFNYDNALILILHIYWMD